MLAMRFEELRTGEDETSSEFYALLNDTVNSSFNLGEKIADNKVVRKILRSLPERFRSKVYGHRGEQGYRYYEDRGSCWVFSDL
jgi:hypothetical protein